jgi:hypothetical protein
MTARRNNGCVLRSRVVEMTSEHVRQVFIKEYSIDDFIDRPITTKQE